MKVTPSPTRHWSSNQAQSTPTTAYRSHTAHTTLPDIKQTLLPRSLDVSFTLRYRR